MSEKRDRDQKRNLQRRENRISKKREDSFAEKDFPSRGPLSFLIGFSLMIICFTISALVMPHLFKLTGTPSKLIEQVLTSAAGLLFLGSIMSIFGRMFKRFQDNHLMVHANLIDDVRYVVEQIALGNLNVKTRGKYHKNEPLADLVESVNNMAAEVGSMEKMRMDFVSNVSHEIQSPLTSIRGFAQLLRNPEIATEDYKQYLDIIESESRRLSNLSDNLLKLSSLESEKRVVELKEFALDHQIQEVILSCEPQWAAKQIELDVALDKVMIKADRELLSQVWLNLLHNGIKFAPVGGAIQLSLAVAGESAVFKISNTGTGISDEDKIHIFERFYKGDKSRNREKGGNGLGLAIVKKILDLHSGEISIETELGKVTTFTVRLPLN